MKLLGMATAAVILSATPAIAQDKKDDERSDEQQVQCRYERVTGSRTKARRICMTRGEWQRHMSAQQEHWRQMKGDSANTGIQNYNP